MEINIYKLRALTNLQAGRGANNYSVIDNLVQRDATSNLPTINGSSIKGAVREYFSSKWEDEKVNILFGSEDKERSQINFLPADLIAIPVRSNKRAYYLATCPSILKRLSEKYKTMGITVDFGNILDQTVGDGAPVLLSGSTKNLVVEDYENCLESKDGLECKLIGSPDEIMLFSENDFKDICGDLHLPVIARNKVGENLWYEQVVPRESLMLTPIFHTSENYKSFEDELLPEGKIIHIGANATVGYGFCKFYELKR